MSFYKLIILSVALIGSASILPMHRQIASRLINASSFISSTSTKMKKLTSKRFFITPSKFALYLANAGTAGFGAGVGLSLYAFNNILKENTLLEQRLIEKDREYMELQYDSLHEPANQDDYARREKSNTGNPNFLACHHSQQDKRDKPVR